MAWPAAGAGPAAGAFAFASPWGQPLAGKTALVTGAGRGIGQSINVDGGSVFH
jgi:hypothetical protein